MTGVSIAGLAFDTPTLMATGLAFLIALLGTRLLIGWLVSREVLDKPNERSSHDVPTPRGGGIAVVSAIVIAAFVHGLATDGLPVATAVALVAATGLAALSFIDDMTPLSAKARLAGHVLAVLLGLGAIYLETGSAGVLGSPVPIGVDLVLTAFAWVWLVNLYNFMDGIDGISGVQTGAIGLGFAGLAALDLAPFPLLPLGLAMTAASIGFLVWNWSPARIFLGDVGSVPLGYLAGFMIVSVGSDEPAISGPWVAAMILPAYYVADATITLGRRIAKRENILHAHRQHFYQQAVIRGRGHATVSAAVLLANLGLVTTAWHVAPTDPASAALAAISIVAVLMLWMRYWPTTQAEPAA